METGVDKIFLHRLQKSPFCHISTSGQLEMPFVARYIIKLHGKIV